jgi:hypothetical protein
MTLHQVWVFYAGIVFCADAFVLFGAFKALGPTYKDRITVSWRLRGAVFVLAVICLIRGITLVFPGRSVHVQFVPWMVPAIATAIFGVVTLATEWIISHRAPPPVMQRLLASVAALIAPRYADYATAQAMMIATSSPPEAGDDRVRFAGPRLRYAVITACVLGLLMLLAVVLQAAAADLPR